MSDIQVAIVTTGTANLASVQAAFSRLEMHPVLTDSPEVVAKSKYVVVPGVGTLGAAMQTLRGKELIEAVSERFAQNQATMGICVGMQVLAESSEESPNVAGLGILKADVTRLPEGQRVPHMGWNRVEPLHRSDVLHPGYAYFANSYCFVASKHAEALQQEGWEIATTHYGIEFISAIRRGKLLACQFHPELSGAFGSQLLARWIAVGKEEIAC